MDATLAPAASPATTAARALPAPLDRLLALPARSRLRLALAAAAVAGVLALSISLTQQTSWRVLYTGLADKDGGAVIAALTQMNVAHQIAEGGGAILVPADQVHALRLRLASQGLPKGGAVGFELMENQKFGTTQFQERLNFQRGLEGELARSIMALSAVQSARVHLALPQQTAFLREQQKPSASVLLTLHGGRTLERGQIAGIVHLVASSVPDLQPKAVSILDQSGALLSQDGADAPNGLDPNQQQYVRQLEQNLATRVLAIVEPLVGPGNVKAQVTADVDFTQSESTAEMFAPNQGSNPAAVRSQHLSETPGAGGASAGGVPGALSNQPVATPPSTVNGPAQALSAGAAAGAGVGGSKRDAVTNYEVDKTTKVTRSASGQVRRLNAAVVINHTLDAKGAARALPPEQMEQINALVREAVGFSKERGDSVNVVNAPFRTLDVATPELPLWKQPETRELARQLAPWIALPLVALVVILGLVRPALRAARGTAVDGNGKPRLLDATVHDAVPLPHPGAPTDVKVSVNLPETGNSLPGADGSVPLLPTAQAAAQHTRNAQVESIRQLARQNPATVANVVRNWVTTPAA